MGRPPNHVFPVFTTTGTIFSSDTTREGRYSAFPASSSQDTLMGATQCRTKLTRASEPDASRRMPTDDTLGIPRLALNLSLQALEYPTSRIGAASGEALDATATICGKWPLKADDCPERATNITEYDSNVDSVWGFELEPWDEMSWSRLVIAERPTSTDDVRSGGCGLGSESSITSSCFSAARFRFFARLPWEAGRFRR